MNFETFDSEIGFDLHRIIQILLPSSRQPASRSTWVAASLFVPILGILVYLLPGETTIGRQRQDRDIVKSPWVTVELPGNWKHSLFNKAIAMFGPLL
jgi:hypothetical protein